MNQPDLFSAPPVNGSGVTLAASRSGAMAVVETWTARQSAYLQLLRNAGSLTDKEAAALLKWDVSSVNSVRNALGERITTDGYDEQFITLADGRRRKTTRTRFKVAA